MSSSTVYRSLALSQRMLIHASLDEQFNFKKLAAFVLHAAGHSEAHRGTLLFQFSCLLFDREATIQM
jgi:hypothetical protein